MCYMIVLFKQSTAYSMRISDWSSDVCSSDLDFYFSCTDIRAYDLAVTHSAWCFDFDGRNYHADRAAALVAGYEEAFGLSEAERAELGRASCRERVCQYV